MPRFDDIATRAGRVTSRVYGGPVRITPRRSGNQYVGPTADPDRDVQVVTAIFGRAPTVTNPAGQHRGNAGSGATVMGAADTIIRIEAFHAAGMPWEPVRDDLVELLDPRYADQPPYAVVGVGSADSGDLIVTLAREVSP